MSMNRREFLKIAGASAVAGIGGVSVMQALQGSNLEASHVLQDEKALKAKQWAMVVDMDKFKSEEDYQRIINTCHSIHNVPDLGKTNQEIKWIWTDTYEHTFPGQENAFMEEKIRKMPFVLLCNHCENPPCVRVCPTKATFKRKDGIVMMDQHRCIGCRFCMAACPFGARSFNFKDPRPFIKKINPEYPARTIGVVEKCTFCFERLAKGLQPACVEESRGALIFGDLADQNSDVRKILNSRYSLRRRTELGTQPSVYYLIGGKNDA